MFLFVFLLGLAGTIYGLVISSVTTMVACFRIFFWSRESDRQPGQVHEAMQMALGSFFPVMLLSGVLWPKQSVRAFRPSFSSVMSV
jgi:hypothetical protein